MSFDALILMPSTNCEEVQDVPNPERPETWAFQLGTSWLGKRDPNLSNEERIERVKRATSELAEPFRSANQWIPVTQLLKMTRCPIGCQYILKITGGESRFAGMRHILFRLVSAMK